MPHRPPTYPRSSLSCSFVFLIPNATLFKYVDESKHREIWAIRAALTLDRRRAMDNSRLRFNRGALLALVKDKETITCPVAGFSESNHSTQLPQKPVAECHCANESWKLLASSTTTPFRRERPHWPLPYILPLPHCRILTPPTQTSSLFVSRWVQWG